jgi:hypothetical protein
MTSKRYNVFVMAKANRSTVYFEEDLYKALKIKAATTNRRVSALVNEAVRESLREDAIDLEAVRKRRKDPRRSFEAVLKDLKKKGRL